MPSRAFALALVGALFCAAGCRSTPPALPTEQQKASLRAEIYARAATHFIEAALLKPSGLPEDELPFRMAPLLLLKVDGETNVLGGLVLKDGQLELDLTQAMVYFELDSVLLKGTPQARLTYLWFFRPHGEGKGIGVQGVRMTLNRSGYAVIWETLTDASGLELIFASQQVESAALLEHGKPAGSRRFAVEEITSDAQNTIVGRIIEDGPVPMGPIVYLAGPDQSVRTLICRCMPAQAGKLSTTGSYELRPWLAVSGAADVWKSQNKLARELSFWPNQESQPPKIERVLRLPSSF